MKKESNKLNAAIQKVIVSSLFALLFVITMVNVVLKKDFNFLTQTFNYTPEYAYQLLGDIGEAGRRSHLLGFLPDILMVFLYTVLTVIFFLTPLVGLCALGINKIVKRG